MKTGYEDGRRMELAHNRVHRRALTLVVVTPYPLLPRVGYLYVELTL
jgi:hypothetical protein